MDPNPDTPAIMVVKNTSGLVHHTAILALIFVEVVNSRIAIIISVIISVDSLMRATFCHRKLRCFVAVVSKLEKVVPVVLSQRYILCHCT